MSQKWSEVIQNGIETILNAPFLRPETDLLRENKIDIAALGLPFDAATIARPGARFGPHAMREASKQFFSYHYDYRVDIADYFRIADCGDVPVVPGSAEKTFAAARETLAKVYKAGAMPMLIGGDHSCTIAGTRAFAEQNPGKKFGMIVFDTHLDTTVEIEGERLTPYSPMTRTLELPCFDPKHFVIIGPHGAANPVEEQEFVEKSGVRVLTVGDVMERGISVATLEALSIATDGTDGVYLSVDMDCMDGAFAPGLCVPEPGGLTARELLTAVGMIGRAGVAAMDLVEVLPTYDPSGLTARLACRVLLDLLASRAAELRKNGAGN